MAREASAQTVFIRNLVSKNEEITFGDAKEALVKAGFGDCTDSQFAMTKYLWLKAQKEATPPPAPAKKGKDKPLPPPKHKVTASSAVPTPATPDLAAAVKFVTENGGLVKVRASLAERRAALERDEALVTALETGLGVESKAS